MKKQRRNERPTMSANEVNIICKLYESLDRSVDQLPYTIDFETFIKKFIKKSGRRISRHEFWLVVLHLRKKKGFLIGFSASA